jgi:GxxExxY protein
MFGLTALKKACAKVSDEFKLYPHLSEAVYQRALQVELLRQHDVVAVETEVVLPVEYRGYHVGTVRADLVVNPKENADYPCPQETVIELKKVPRITQSHIDQLYTYVSLKMQKTESTVHGAVVNFGVRPPEIRFLSGDEYWDNIRHERNHGDDSDPTRSPSPARAKSRSRSRSRSPDKS